MKTLETHTVEALFDFDRQPEDDREVILVEDLRLAKVVIEVRGGIVQAVYVTPALKPINVVVLDYDNEEQGQKFSREQKQAEAEIEQGKVTEIL